MEKNRKFSKGPASPLLRFRTIYIIVIIISFAVLHTLARCFHWRPTTGRFRRRYHSLARFKQNISDSKITSHRPRNCSNVILRLPLYFSKTDYYHSVFRFCFVFFLFIVFISTARSEIASAPEPPSRPYRARLLFCILHVRVTHTVHDIFVCDK